ncbi:MAG: TPM domain-containing protein [Leptospirales bacterium]|nr:TPM domain-containing protein [Leptospirales bacterium]
MSRKLQRLILAGALCSTPFAALAAREVPYLSGRVNDTAHMMSAAQVEKLEAQLAEQEKQTSNQVAILTIDSLQGEILETYSLKVAETWKLGRADVDNGVLFLIVRDERLMRIEVGQGLEGALGDAICRRILDLVVKPHFKQGDFDGGVQAGVDAILGVIKGEYTPPDESEQSDSGFGDIPILVRILSGLLIFFVLGIFTWVLIIMKEFTWFLYLFLIPFYAIFPAIPLGVPGNFIALAIYLLGVPLLRLIIPKTKAGARWRSNAGNWVSTSSGGSGGWSSSSSSGSSFSGGGGGFSGGGASSSW